MTSSNIERTYRPLCLEAVFSDQLLDICFETPLAGEESPCIVGSVRDDPRAAIYASLFIAAPDLVNSINALLGLIQLVTHRNDIPPSIKAALMNSHRIIEAKAALSKAGAL